MANRLLTEKMLKEVKKHPVEALEQVDMILGDPKSGYNWKDIDFVACLEHDFGPNFRGVIQGAKDDAMEAIVTSGMFNKMAQKAIRFGLMETPKEEYMISRLAGTGPPRGECEESYRDWGVFSDMKWHEVAELVAAPLYGLATDYLDHPNGRPGGLGMAVTREALCKDPNGFFLKSVPKIKDAHDEKRENDLIDALIGYNTTYNRSGTEYNIYYDDGTVFTDGASGPWVNSSPTSIVCPEDFQVVKNLTYDMVDLVHGRPNGMDTNNLDVITSDLMRDQINPLLNATSHEKDVTCGAGDYHFLMTPEVSNGMTFSPMAYKRFAERIVLRYGITLAQAKDWIWMGKLSEFVKWVYQVQPEVRRCALGSDECRKRIVAIYDSYSLGYAYIEDPQKGILLTNGY